MINKKLDKCKACGAKTHCDKCGKESKKLARITVGVPKELIYKDFLADFDAKVQKVFDPKKIEAIHMVIGQFCAECSPAIAKEMREPVFPPEGEKYDGL